MAFSPPDFFNIFDYFLGERIAEGHGHKRALLTDTGGLTYREVFDLSGRYAGLLVELGARPGERVLIALPDGPDYVGALFGALRMGAVVVMMNPFLKPEQIRYFYDYTSARAAFVGQSVMGAFEEAGAGADAPPELVSVGDPGLAERLSAIEPDVPTWPSTPDDPAIWLFSGGTTGEPKAVVQTHRSFANTTELYGKGVLGMRPDDITLSVPKLFFGYATGTNLFFPFSVGATSALFPERCTAETLFAKLGAFRPTVLVNVPTMVNNLLGHESVDEQDLSSLRLSTSAGEALPVELHRRWDERFGVPLRVRGDSLALGYWQDEEKTQEAFQDGWYVSGDMISVDTDGYVTYCGRADDMLKVSGKWLSPKELENCLLEHPDVHEAVVVGTKTTDGLVKPWAYVTLVGGGNTATDLATTLQGWVKDRLEPYKYPRRVVVLDELPRTHLGKVDRGRLAREAQ
jgi:acyl-coenzyme A synthetase/AMP-(fatty) acid ligase